MGHACGVIERERKYRLNDEDASRLRKLLSERAVLVVRETQENIVFRDRASRLRKGTYLRLRACGTKRELTFKGKKTLKGLDKSRLELTVQLGEGQVMELLAAIGLQPHLRYVKETEIWAIGGVHVSLDEVGGIGRFCELEAHDESADLQAVADALSLRDEAWEPRGYPTLAALIAERKASG